MVESWSRLPRHPAAAVHSELRRARGPQRERLTHSLIALPAEPRRERESAHASARTPTDSSQLHVNMRTNDALGRGARATDVLTAFEAPGCIKWTRADFCRARKMRIKTGALIWSLVFFTTVTCVRGKSFGHLWVLLLSVLVFPCTWRCGCVCEARAVKTVGALRAPALHNARADKYSCCMLRPVRESLITYLSTDE